MENRFFTITTHDNEQQFNIGTISAKDYNTLLEAIKKPLEQHFDGSLVSTGLSPESYDMLVSKSGQRFPFKIEVEDIDGDSLRDFFCLSQTCLYQTEKFPNGFDSWQETHFEICQEIANQFLTDSRPEGRVMQAHETGGHGSLYELAKEMTDKFENLHKDRLWDGEFFEEIELFIESEL